MAEQATTTRKTTEPVARLAAATAGQLRLVADAHADAAPDARAGRLSDVVREALDRVELPNRDAFLAALESHFPTWDADPSSAAPMRDVPAATDSAASRREYVDAELLNDPEFLLRKLAALAPKLTPAQRQAIGGQLAKHFAEAAPPERPSPIVSPKPPPATVRAATGEGATLLQQATGLAQHAVDPERMAAALALLFDLCGSIDDAAWGTWEHLVTRGGLETNVKRKATLKPTLARMLTGDVQVAPANVAPAVRDLRGLAVGLISAAGDNVKRTNDAIGRLSPDAIEDLVPKRSVEAWRRAACWDAYRKRYAETAATIQQGVAGEVKASVEFYFRGSGT